MKNPMTDGRRTPVVWCGLALIATLTGPRTSQPVHEVQVVASRFTFEPATIQVIAAESVRRIVRSKDGTHGFAIPKLKIDLHVPDNGEPVTTEFTAPAKGSTRSHALDSAATATAS